MHLIPSSPATLELQQCLSQGFKQTNLAETALLLAKIEYPHLEVLSYMQRFEDMANRVREKIVHQSTPNMIIALNQILFEEEGFFGNADHYYDPKNSFLNEVLDRKAGIPITLSIIYLEVGLRLGLPLKGISFPGHFLVKLEMSTHSMLVLDPFSKGLPLNETLLNQRLKEAQGKGRAGKLFLRQALQTASTQDILVRMLRNLKDIYLRSEQWTKLLPIMEQLLIINPDLAEEWRDRGMLYQRLECAKAAVSDYERYLSIEPYAIDSDFIEEQINQLTNKIKYFH
jgi:regulator of sirC expression with transglutaminase-like and TPR domain